MSAPIDDNPQKLIFPRPEWTIDFTDVDAKPSEVNFARTITIDYSQVLYPSVTVTDEFVTGVLWLQSKFEKRRESIEVIQFVISGKNADERSTFVGKYAAYLTSKIVTPLSEYRHNIRLWSEYLQRLRARPQVVGSGAFNQMIGSGVAMGYST